MTAPNMWTNNDCLYPAEIGRPGNCGCPPPCCCPCPAPPAPVNAQVRFIKRSALTHLPLAGATFTLQSESQLLTVVSGPNGIVDFGTLPAGSYQLQEISAPAGYQVDSAVRIVRVDSKGNATIDGIPAAEYSFNNEVAFDFTFQKIAGIGNPLAGAQFTLFQNRIPLQVAVSDAAGLVHFTDLEPGVYFMIETAAPPGYWPLDIIFLVLVAQDGTVTINGELASDFVVNNEDDNPPAPAFLPVYEGTGMVFGHGSPGCEIGVTFPSGETVFALVDADGDWEAAVPAGETLTAGMTLNAFQACSGIAPIIEISTTVLALPT